MGKETFMRPNVSKETAEAKGEGLNPVQRVKLPPLLHVVDYKLFQCGTS